MKFLSLLPLVVVMPILGMSPMQESKIEPEFNRLTMSQSQELNNWVIVNDTVMGGRSFANLVMAEQGLRFEGVLSLANNGGFASIRRIKNNGQWHPNKPLKLNVMGDGRVYQFRLRTDKTFDGIAYSVRFQTQAGVATSHTFSVDDFTPQWRGRKVIGAAPLQFSDITQIGVLLGDKREGRFELVIKDVSQ